MLALDAAFEVRSHSGSRTISVQDFFKGYLTTDLKEGELLTELRILRDDVDVLAAIVRRLDNNQALMLDELRAMHAQQQRTAARVRSLEDARPA